METVQFQGYVFSSAVYGGIIIGILYDIYGVIRRRKRNEKLIASIWDAFFLLSVLLVAVGVIFSSNYGDIRAYVFIGFTVGFYLYEKLLGRIAVAIFQAVMRKLSYFFKTTNNVLTIPVKGLGSLSSLAVKRLLVQKRRLKRIKGLPKRLAADTKKYYRLILKKQIKRKK